MKQEQARRVDEGQDQKQYRVNRVLCPDDHERRRHCDEREQIEEQSLQTHFGAFSSPGRFDLMALPQNLCPAQSIVAPRLFHFNPASAGSSFAKDQR